jgi:hypothetical protein
MMTGLIMTVTRPDVATDRISERRSCHLGQEAMLNSHRYQRLASFQPKQSFFHFPKELEVELIANFQEEQRKSEFFEAAGEQHLEKRETKIAQEGKEDIFDSEWDPMNRSTT